MGIECIEKKAHRLYGARRNTADCPVVPIALAGTRAILPPGAKFPRFVKGSANVGKEIRFEKVNAI